MTAIAVSPVLPAIRPASFLYLRGRVFYYRHRLTQKLVARGFSREIRVCLRTSYQVLATKIVHHLRSLTVQMLEKWEMTEPSGIPDIHGQIEAFRAVLREEVNKILSADPKCPVSFPDIQKRLNEYLRQKLDRDAESTDLPPVAAIEHADGSSQTYTLGEAYADGAAEIQSEILSGERYDEHYHNAIIELTRQGVFNPEEITEQNAPTLVKAFMVMQVKLLKILSARYNGDYALEQQLCPQTAVDTSSKEQGEAQKDKANKSMLLDELIEKYITTNVSDGRWKSHGLSDHRSRLTSLFVIIGNKNINEYSRDDMRNFRDTLLKLPTNWRKIYNMSGKSLEELIDSANDEATLAPKTVNVHIQALSSMFQWAINEGLLQINPAKGLSIRDEQPAIDKRGAFTKEEITSIFFSGDYTPNNFSKPSYYWVPLIGLYTGMRLEEICQLHTEDIYEEDGLYVINISSDSSDGLKDKILKTKNAIRKVPIHSKLIDLGLIDYRNKVISSGKIRLFPELNKTNNTPKYGKQVGKHFASLVARKNISDGKTFHSLRHSFSDFFKKKNLHTDIFRQVFGHESTELAARQYGSRFTPKEIYDGLISLIDFHEKKLG